MPQFREVSLPDEAATTACGARLGAVLALAAPSPFVVHLQGELGSGKTTLVRGALGAMGVGGTIRSPTYTLVETYAAGDAVVAHLDLYRVVAPRELEALAVRELLAPGHVLFIEWPERGGDALPPPDLALELRFAPNGRALHARAVSRAAEAVVQEWFR